MDASGAVDRSIVVVPISGLDELEVHAEAYDRFVAGTPDGQAVFYSRAWMAAMMPLYCPMPGQLLFLLAVMDGAVVGLAPLCFQTSSRGRRLIRRLTTWGADQHSLMVEGSIPAAAAVTEEACMQAFRDYLFQSCPERIDCVELRYIRTESTCLASLRKVFPRTHIEAESMDSYQVLLQGSFDSFIGTRSKSLIKQLGKLERALARDVGFRFEMQEKLTPLELAEIENLHSRRQNELVDAGRSRSSLFQDECAATCYRNVLDMLSERKQACYYSLKVGDQIIAVLIAFRAGPVLIGHLTAFDSTYAKYSPGKLLHLKVIEAELKLARHSKIDLMPGRTKVKTDFCDIVYPRERVVIVNSYRLQSLVRFALWALLVRAVDVAREVLKGVHKLPDRLRPRCGER